VRRHGAADCLDPRDARSVEMFGLGLPPGLVLQQPTMTFVDTFAGTSDESCATNDRLD